ncbi:MATE family efflux transporter [Sutcliffiella horikoshii]|uniref:MATE family efflux transporter n=1 Tax=Sutcliffiella horikoshii TaxID=79883 RepID=UPI00203A5DD6|nr:MATE family efflux transporter [Sutcliffiella horikoshii]MCM3617905.1 MATE family efflux transporter [Sutcliffiella horikoshii]
MDTKWRTLFKFSLPVTLIGIADLLLILIDLLWIRVFIGDTDALSALRLSTTIITFIEMVLIAVISALLIFISQNYSAGKTDQAKEGIKNAFSFSVYSGVVVMLLGFCILPFIKYIFGVNDSVNGYLNNYLLVYFAGYVFFSLNNFLMLLPRYFQKLKIIYMSLLFAILINIIITPLAMLLFDYYNMSMMSGAAAGTVLANVISTLYLLVRIFNQDFLKIGLYKAMMSFKPTFQIIKENKKFVSSQIFNGITFNLSMFFYIIILSYYPDEAFNVYAVGMYAFMVFGVFAQNFAASLIPIVSGYMGKEDIKSIKETVRKVFIVLGGYGIFVVSVILLSNDILASALSSDAEMIARFKEFFLLYSIPWALNTISFIFIFVVAGSGDYKGGMYLTITNMYVIVLGSLLIIPNLFSDKVSGVIIALSLINIMTFINSLTYYLMGKWQSASLVKKAKATKELSAS